MEVLLTPGRWSPAEVEVPQGARWIWLEVPLGAAIPCLESLTFL
jgi:hypothetical protein